MNGLFLFFGISLATPALRQEVKSLINEGKCKKASQISEVWEKERSKAWKHWSLRAQALECAKAPIDRIYYAYRMYLWYGGTKTNAIKSRMKELYPSLYDLRVTIKPPKSLRNIKTESISLEILERPWAPFNKKRRTAQVPHIPTNVGSISDSTSAIPVHMGQASSTCGGSGARL